MSKANHLNLILKELISLQSQINKLETSIKEIDLKLDIQKILDENTKK
jgi:hypothetical protein